jgi:hypothetical protein
MSDILSQDEILPLKKHDEISGWDKTWDILE